MQAEVAPSCFISQCQEAFVQLIKSCFVLFFLTARGIMCLLWCVCVVFVVEVSDGSLYVSHVACSVAIWVDAAVCTVDAEPFEIKRFCWVWCLGVEARDEVLDVSHSHYAV